MGHIGNRCRCRECCKIVSQISDVRRHLRIHMGLPEIGCDECGGRAFIQYANYVKHCANIHPEQPVKPKPDEDFILPEYYCRDIISYRDDVQTGDESTSVEDSSDSYTSASSDLD